MGLTISLLITLIDFTLNTVRDIWLSGMLALWPTVTSTVTSTSTLTSTSDLTSTFLRQTTGVQRQGAHGWPACFSTLFDSRDFPAESVWIQGKGIEVVAGI